MWIKFLSNQNLETLIIQIKKIKITNLLVWEVFNDFIKIIFHGMVKRTSFISNKKNFKNKEN